MNVGFTGTQEGMSASQCARVIDLLLKLRLGMTHFHHGDCIGADEQAHQIIRAIAPTVLVVGHPPSNPAKRAFCQCDILMEEKPYLERNQDIVAACELLIATPKGPETLYSGTWATVRAARRKGIRIDIVER
jgi:hypothetical protein